MSLDVRRKPEYTEETHTDIQAKEHKLALDVIRPYMVFYCGMSSTAERVWELFSLRLFVSPHTKHRVSVFNLASCFHKKGKGTYYNRAR